MGDTWMNLLLPCAQWNPLLKNAKVQLSYTLP
jgi:hypothetical protein